MGHTRTHAPINTPNLNLNQPTTTARKEVAEPFSAADRDAPAERFGTLKECFKAAHNPLYPISIRVRVFICDDVSDFFFMVVVVMGGGHIRVCLSVGVCGIVVVIVAIIPYQTQQSRPISLSTLPHHIHHHPHPQSSFLQRTGKVALLYQSGKSTKRHAKSPNASYVVERMDELRGRSIFSLIHICVYPTNTNAGTGRTSSPNPTRSTFGTPTWCVFSYHASVCVYDRVIHFSSLSRPPNQIQPPHKTTGGVWQGRA